MYTSIILGQDANNTHISRGYSYRSVRARSNTSTVCVKHKHILTQIVTSRFVCMSYSALWMSSDFDVVWVALENIQYILVMHGEAYSVPRRYLSAPTGYHTADTFYALQAFTYLVPFCTPLEPSVRFRWVNPAHWDVELSTMDYSRPRHRLSDVYNDGHDVHVGNLPRIIFSIASVSSMA